VAKKVYELARELKMDDKDLVRKLKVMGIKINTALSELSDEDYQRGLQEGKAPVGRIELDSAVAKAKKEALNRRKYEEQFKVPPQFKNPQQFSGAQGERMQAYIKELKSNLRNGKYAPEEADRVINLITKMEDLKIENDLKVGRLAGRKGELAENPELTKKPEQTYRNDPKKLEELRLEKEARIAAERNKKPNLQNPDPEMRYTPATKSEYMPRSSAQQAAIDKQKNPTKGTIGRLLTDYNDEYARVMSKQVAKETGEKAIKEVASEVGEEAGKEIAQKLFKKYAGKLAIGALTGGLSLGAEAASEGLDSQDSGARKNMPDYWLERGVRDRDEQIQRARLSSFKEDLPSYNKIPGAYEKPELRKYKEDVLRAEKEGTLRDNYVEDTQEEDDYKKFKSLMGKLR
jgi:phage gp16-like protein